MTELIGQRLGDYQLEALLASGATGPLYGARHLRLGRPAAVRLFDADLLARPGLQPRLEAALRTVASLRHPHLALIYDVGEHEKRLFLASELPSGGTLRVLPRETALATWLELAAQAADGLAYVHAAGVVHGAIRPELLLLEPQPAPAPPALKLSGLGIAALLPELALEAPAYLSPEQCRGLALDGRADIYSLGVVLYEMLIGVPPFRVDSVEAAIAKHLRTNPVPPRVVRPQLPAAVEALVLRCLAKLPGERFTDATALAAELRRIGAELVSAGPALMPLPLSAIAESASGVSPPSAPISATPAPRIAIFGSQGALLRTADLGAGTLSLGRAPERDLFLDDPQISREQLRLDWDGRQLTVTDPGSSNGSFLGGARLPVGLAIPWDGRVPLRVGPFMLRVEGAPGAPGATAPLDAALLAGLLTPDAAPAPGASSTGARIELHIEQERAVLTPGSPTMVPVRIINSGQTAAEATLAVEGVPEAWIRASDLPVIRLNPGTETTTSLLVTVPRDPVALAGDYQIILRAKSIGAPAEAGTARMRWTVLPFAALDLRLNPPSGEGRGAVDYQIMLRNGGNAPTTCLLSFEDTGVLGFSLAQDEVVLAPGQSARVGLSVEAGGRLFGNPETHRFAIKAEAQDGQNQLAEGELVHLARLPPWLPLTLLGSLLLIVLIAVAGALLSLGGGGSETHAPSATATPFPTPLPGAPTILEFRVVPELTAPGELVRVVWNIQGAERVVIDRFGDVPAVGEREFRPDQRTEFRLSATMGERETVGITYANVAPATPMPTPEPTPTLLPTLPAPTEVPALPTELPPAPTEVPPLPTEAPPLPTEAPPPTEVPVATVVPPIEVLPTAPSEGGEPPALVTLELTELASRASWSTGAGPVSFGRPLFFASRGGWADLASATLEDDQQIQGLLRMVPPAATARNSIEVPYIEGEFALPALASGQVLVGAVGFAQGVNSEPLSVAVSFNDQVIFEATKAPDGTLLPIFADLSAYAGQAGRLTLRVSGLPSTSSDGLFWVRPRIDVPR